MKKKYLYVTDSFEGTHSGDTVIFNDHKLKKYYPDFYEAKYDLKLLITTKPTKAEKESPIYNSIYEEIGSEDISALKDCALNKNAKRVILNGFGQEHFDYIAPYLKDKTEILFLFKCPRISDLSPLADFKELKCLYIYWNNKLEKLWDMKNNTKLEILSFISISKLSCVNALKDSTVKYISFDSTGNYPNKKDCLIEDMSAFEQMPQLQHLKLVYKNCDVDY